MGKFLDAVSQTRLQDEYNKAIKECDIFLMLFFTKVGKYAEEEFEKALDSLKKPRSLLFILILRMQQLRQAVDDTFLIIKTLSDLNDASYMLEVKG